MGEQRLQLCPLPPAGRGGPMAPSGAVLVARPSKGAPALSKEYPGLSFKKLYHQRLGVALQEVELVTAANDGYVHFGDVLQCVHLESGSVLACDVGDADMRPGELSCAATAAPQLTAPCARNCLILLKYQPPPNSTSEPEFDGDILRYGQKVRIACHPFATGQPLDSAGGPRPLCLFSKPVSTTHCAKYSRSQLVGFTYKQTYDTVWEVVTPEPAERALSVGLEVLAGAPILLLHCATQKPLLADVGQKYPNDFGIEFELSARVNGSKGLKLALEQSSKGLLKGTLRKGEHSDTFWAFMAGDKVARLPEPESRSSPASQEALHAVVEELLAAPGGIASLERKLLTWSTTQSQLPSEELLMLLRQVGLHTVDRHAAALAAAFEVPAKPGVVDAAALLGALREAAGGSSSPLQTGRG
ncbi:hypothetical protein QJQ45_010424 [Haematococcus lacustris]|nr:hypothetical protein QJQ45_010424 [Haematococcus lacustris]